MDLLRTRWRIDALGDGITRLTLENRLTGLLGFPVTLYLLDELLVDSGFMRARAAVKAALSGRPLVVIALTHHHEDHSGNAGVLGATAIYLHQPQLQWSEGVGDLLPYRHIAWGPPAPYVPSAMPPVIECGLRRLTMVPTPGHCATQVALLEERTGVVFTGDLLIGPGAGAVMTHEDPWQHVQALRRVADLGARRMLTGHGQVIDDPPRALRRKADRIEAVAHEVLELHLRRRSVGTIVAQLFPRGRGRDLAWAGLTRREFSRANFVRAVLSRWPTAAQEKPS